MVREGSCLANWLGLGRFFGEAVPAFCFGVLVEEACFLVFLDLFWIGVRRRFVGPE